MPHHPFYKYSFFVLLVVDICYVLGLILAGLSPANMEAFKAALIWFVCFYWLPVWACAWVIFTLRDKGYAHTIVEWLLSCLFMIMGMWVTNWLLVQVFDGYPGIGNNVFFGGVTWASVIYFACRFIESNKKSAVEKRARKEAQLATLRYQLNPHFMFNSLNTISAYIHTKPDIADSVLHDLADILRFSLDTAEEKEISLQQEVDIAHKYIGIEKVRFGDNLDVVFTLPADINNIQIPPLLLQPIIENAIKHNSKQTSLRIDVHVTFQHGHLQLNVKDNGRGFPKEVLAKGYGQGVGMQNLVQRVGQLKGGHISLSNDNGASVKVEMAI